MSDEELRRLFDEFRRENVAAHAQTREYVDRGFSETRREAQITAEGLRGDIRLIAEAVGQLGEKVDREVAGLHAKVDRGFAETQAMIKLSYERLETTTH